MIKRSPSLTDQVKSHIKEQILNDEFEDNRIPSETDLANDLGVSRTTVRDALSRLENEGIIYRKQGVGTFINRPGLQIKSRLDEIWSYEAVLEAHGYRPSTKVINVRLELAEAAVANALNLPAEAEILVVHKLFLEDHQPVILTYNYIPQMLIHKPYETEDLKVPVFDFLAEFGDQHLSYYLSEIVPVVATESLAQILHVPALTAVLSLEEVGYNEENEPILKACSYFRDDLLRLGLIRRKV
ncbi:MAG: GntR family transcriptional regulator [Chloroflexota bacterium]|jgi:GntR family transcriptional regulator